MEIDRDHDDAAFCLLGRRLSVCLRRPNGNMLSYRLLKKQSLSSFVVLVTLQTVAEAAVGLGGLQPPLDPKTQWSPSLAPPSFWRRKDEEEGEEEERKEEISPPFKNFWIRHWPPLLRVPPNPVEVESFCNFLFLQTREKMES